MSAHPSLRDKKFPRRRTRGTKGATHPGQARASARKFLNRSRRTPADPVWVAAQLEALKRRAAAGRTAGRQPPPPEKSKQETTDSRRSVTNFWGNPW